MSGVSFDQKLNAAVGLFARYGQQETDLDDDDHFYSVGVGFQNGLIFNPDDTWGVGYSQMDLASGDSENLDRGLLQPPPDREAAAVVPSHACARLAGEGESFGYIFPGIRLQAAF